MDINHRPLKILHLQLEFPRWEQARHWAYSAQFALTDGLRNIGVECFAVNSTCLTQLRKLCRGKRFDQVWLEIVHIPPTEEVFDWIAALAPVRVGFVCESLEYSTEDYLHFPILSYRKQLVEEHIKYLTHVMMTDEQDVIKTNLKNSVRAMWLLPCIPKRFIFERDTTPTGTVAVFCGAIYGSRTNWLNNPELQGILIRQPSSESGTLYPMFYNTLQLSMHRYLKYVGFADKKVHDAYMYSWHYLRCICFSRWLRSMREGCAVVNLPSLVKAYTGRVIEGMATGIPVISWEIPDRPRTKLLFENNKEIILFSQDNPLQLADHIKRLRLDSNFSCKLAVNAQRKIKEFHTAEHRAEEILHWIETGEVPLYN